MLNLLDRLQEIQAEKRKAHQEWVQALREKLRTETTDFSPVLVGLFLLSDRGLRVWDRIGPVSLLDKLVPFPLAGDLPRKCQILMPSWTVQLYEQSSILSGYSSYFTYYQSLGESWMFERFDTSRELIAFFLEKNADDLTIQENL